MAKSGDKKAAKALSELSSSPSHLLHRALQRALGIYGEEMGDDALTQRQYALLVAVAAADLPSQTDLVSLTGIDRSTLAELVARLIDKGLLVRERSESDGRAKTVSLTETGRAALDRARPRVKAADKRILALVSKPRREALLKLVTRVGDAPEPPAKAKGRKKQKSGQASSADTR